MERAVVVGNCQAQALEMVLSTNADFAARFELQRFPPVHEISPAEVQALHRAIRGAKLVALQTIDDGYRDGLGLGTDTLAALAAPAATVVRWPSVFWAGYVPDLFYLRDAAGRPVVDGPFDYHDRAILGAYADGLAPEAACRLLEDPERPSRAPERAAEATAELDTRGAGADIQVTEFIARRFRDELLFFTMNHPTNRMLGHITQAISDQAGVPGRVDHHQLAGEILGSTFYPLHCNHVLALGLRFGDAVSAGRVAFRIRGVAYEPAAAVRAFYDYYAAHPDLVELNHAGASA